MKRMIFVFGTLLVGSAAATQGCGDSTAETGSGGPTSSGTGGSPSTTSTTATTGGSGGMTTSTSAGGSGGSGGAATTCADYCSTITAHCTDAFAQYADNQTCMDVCADWADTGMTANSLECHAYHAGVANNDNHCFHAGPWGADPTVGGMNYCGDPCTNFCELAAKECAGTWTSVDACKADCPTFMSGATVGTYNFSSPAVMTNTLACRFYHLIVATETPDPHCSHIGDSTMDQCGTP